MRSRLHVDRSDIAALWLVTARLQEALGDKDAGAQSRSTAKAFRSYPKPFVRDHYHLRTR